MVLPKRLMPHTDREDPTRVILRMLKDDPRETQSSNDIFDPHLNIPYTETPEPSRVIDRRLKLDPRVKKSSSDKLLPS
jgi:hypothetical protein